MRVVSRLETSRKATLRMIKPTGIVLQATALQKTSRSSLTHRMAILQPKSSVQNAQHAAVEYDNTHRKHPRLEILCAVGTSCSVRNINGGRGGLKVMIIDDLQRQHPRDLSIKGSVKSLCFYY
jgi:hypothetical protein